MRTEMKKRNKRQDLLREVVRNNNIKTQAELVKILRKEGYGYTQATISRDIAELDIQKQEGGFYALAEDLHLRRMCIQLVLEMNRVNNLVTVKCQPGTGPGVGAALDNSDLSMAVASISGDDTVLIITNSDKDASNLIESVEKICNKSFSNKD